MPGHGEEERAVPDGAGEDENLQAESSHRGRGEPHLVTPVLQV